MALLFISTKFFLSILLTVSCLEVREESKRVVVESLPLQRTRAAYVVPIYTEYLSEDAHNGKTKN